MAKNKMKEVAKLLGLELEEEFRVEGFQSKYKLTKNGMMYWLDTEQQWLSSCWLEELLTGENQIIKIPKLILDEKEKEYLVNIIKPFRDQVISIAKRSANFGEFIDIMIDEGEIGDCGNIYLPYFKPNSMYKGMEIDKDYTLEELGL